MQDVPRTVAARTRKSLSPPDPVASTFPSILNVWGLWTSHLATERSRKKTREPCSIQPLPALAYIPISTTSSSLFFPIL